MTGTKQDSQRSAIEKLSHRLPATHQKRSIGKKSPEQEAITTTAKNVKKSKTKDLFVDKEGNVRNKAGFRVTGGLTLPTGDSRSGWNR